MDYEDLKGALKSEIKQLRGKRKKKRGTNGERTRPRNPGRRKKMRG